MLTFILKNIPVVPAVILHLFVCNAQVFETFEPRATVITKVKSDTNVIEIT